MTPAEIVSILTAAAGLVTAITALIHSVQTRKSVKAAKKLPDA